MQPFTSRRALVAVATGAILTLTGACNHNGDDVDTDPGPGNDVPGEGEGEGDEGDEGDY